jgi:hypothetical protein
MKYGILKFLILLTIICTGCELIRLIEKKKSNKISPDPSTSIGTVALLSNELSQGNIFGATKLFTTGDSIFNTEQIIDLQDRLNRLGRIIGKKPITYFKIDTLNSSLHRLSVEFDYLETIRVTAIKNDDVWLIKSFEIDTTNQ